MNIYFHPDCLKHTPGPDPTYAPARLQTVIKKLKERGSVFQWRQAPPATKRDLDSIHLESYLTEILSPLAPHENKSYDAETLAVAGTADALLASAGQVLAAVDDILSGAAQQAFCLVTPGGHHAEAELAQGFCFINYVAAAADYAQRQYEVDRIAIVDIDAHHGNGTQSFCWNHPDRLFISLHEETPFSGLKEETGSANNILNLPLPHQSTGSEYLRLFDEQVAPKLSAFAPHFLFVSAGFDGHHKDPLGHLALETQDYHMLGQRLTQMALRHSDGRLVAVLEGGYNLQHLGENVAAFIDGLRESLP